MKSIIKKIGVILLCYLIYILFVLIHETSHLVSAILTNNGIYGIDISWILLGNASVLVQIKNQSSIPIISISGSLINIIACFCIINYQYKRKKRGFLAISFFIILLELANWINSPLLKRGDAYILYEYIGLTNYLLPSICLMGIGFACFFIYYKILLNFYKFNQE